MILQHWSNGNPLWSGGPPPRDAVLTVSYVRAYFNSSTVARRSDWASRCRDSTAPGATCQIPSAPNVRNPSFFSAMSNMTNNQTVSRDPGPGPKSPGPKSVGESGSSPRLASGVGLVVVVAMAMAVLGL